MFKIFLLATLFVAVHSDGKAQYKFELEVHDPHGGGVQTRKEERNGDSTQGEYTIDEKDGSKTKVQYTVYGHHHGHHHEDHHEGHHYEEGQSGHGSSGYHGSLGYQGSSGYHGAQGHSSSSSSLGAGHGYSGYKADQGLGAQSVGYQSSHSSLGSSQGTYGYKLDKGLSGGYHSLSEGTSSLGYGLKHGYSSEAGKSLASQSHLGSSSYQAGHGLSTGGSSGYHYGGSSSGLSSLGYKAGHGYSGGSGASSQSLSLGYQHGNGLADNSLHYSGSSGLSLGSGLNAYESHSEYKQQAAYGAAGYHADQEIKVSGNVPSYSGYAEEHKLQASYKPRYYKPQPSYHQASPSPLSKPAYESGFKPIYSGLYKSDSQGKYQSQQGYGSGAYKGSGDAKSYYNFVTYESGKGGNHYSHGPSYQHEPSYHYPAPQQSVYHSNSGSYGSVSSHALPAQQSYYHTSLGEGYKGASGVGQGSYQAHSKYPAPKPVYGPAVHEETKYESVGYSSGKGGYHYLGASESNNGHKTSYNSYESLPAVTYGSSHEGYGASQGAYGPSHEGYGASQGAYGSSHGGYGASQAAYGSSQGGYGASQSAYGSSHEGYGVSQAAYGSSHGGYGASQATYGSPYGGYGASKEGYGSSHGGLGQSHGGYSLSQGGYGLKKGYEPSLKHESSQGYAPSQGYSSKGGYSSSYGSGGEATSTLKLHTHGADVETLTKHIIPPKYHEGKY